MIRHRLTLATAFAFLLLGAVIIVLVNQAMRGQALEEAEAKAQIVLDRNMAVHRYFAQELRPSVNELIPPEDRDTYFDPTWMSSTHALTHINEEFDRLSETDYLYKDAAVSARSPRNEADSFERAFLAQVQEDPTLESRQTVRLIEGEPFFHVLKRGEVMEPGCLACHGEPETAPRALLTEFGAERSFNRHVGQTVSALSVRIPLAQAYASANRLSLRLSLIMIALLTAVFTLQTLWSRRVVFTPIDRLRHKATEIAESDSALGDQIPMPAGVELQELTAAFNRMSRSLRSARDELEDRVLERTQELSRLVAALEQTEEGVFVTDPSGRVKFANHAMEELAERPASAMVGKTAWSTLPTISGALERVVTCALEGRDRTIGDSAKSGSPIVNADLSIQGDSVRRLELSSSPITEHGSICGAVLVARDVTDKYLLEERVAETRRAESIGILAGGIAHEFNNGLTAILGNAKLALASTESQARPEIEEIVASATRAADLTDRMLAFGQRQLLRPELVRVDTLISELPVRDLLPVDIRYETSLFPATIEVDSLRLAQALLSVIENAVAAMPDGGSLRVCMATAWVERSGEENRDSEEHIRISVTDTGRGMDEHTRRHAFDPFFTTSSRAEATGLGLSLVHGIIAQSGGRVEIHSRPGLGTTVSISLPSAAEAPGNGSDSRN